MIVNLKLKVMTIATISLVLAIISAIIITIDLSKNPQSMKIMKAVWILTALWASIFGLIAYYWFGREKAMSTNDMGGMDMPDSGMEGMNMPSNEMKDMDMGEDSMKGMNKSSGEMKDMPMKMEMPSRPKWQSVTLSSLHCGAGCTLADIIGSILLLIIPVSLFGSSLIGGWVFTFILALITGVYFQFVAIKEMSDLPDSTIIVKALKADFLSLTSWQVGMYCWMYLLMFHFEYITPDSTLTWKFWFAMQQAMLAGLVLAWPMNYILIKVGIKSGM